LIEVNPQLLFTQARKVRVNIEKKLMSTTTSASPIVAVNDIGTPEELLVAIDATIKYFNDGDLVSGIVVKIDRDEVLLDIGYKTEGVIPSRELSIKHDIDPSEIVKPGDRIEALVLQKEDKEGRLILSKKRAQYERAWGDIEKVKNEDGIVKGHVIEVVKGGLIVDIGLRGFLPAKQCCVVSPGMVRTNSISCSLHILKPTTKRSNSYRSNLKHC